MYIESLKKEVTIGTFTRKVSRQVKAELMAGVTARDMSGNIDFPIINMDKSEELKIRLLTGLSQEETDSLTDTEYNELKKEVEKSENTPI